ncbi:DNA-binding transcriptional regulator, IclR family [Paraburkholderia diazotrophica]|uniref:DNA-binding transcriptional regulator, IclR family n=1 Tax=Paraburkholderia diazotrophica TaxID=667676 RepID=A0A1H7ERA9_9BURK|nr:DNA-binding transcriptional regulator, IclR family [Paraburkholderia diazotrophica]
MRLAALYQRSFDVGPVTEPIFQQLSRDLGETAWMYVPQGDQRLVLLRIDPACAVRVSIHVGETFSIDKGASGKVLLAFTERHDARREAVRMQLWAVSHGERDPETASASVPVSGATGELIRALTLSGRKARFDMASTFTAALSALLEAAWRTTVTLGGNGARFDMSMETISRDGFRDCERANRQIK